MTALRPSDALLAAIDSSAGIALALNWDSVNSLTLPGEVFTGPAGATYIDQNGVVQTVGGANTPRPYYSGATRLRLLEGASTNKCLRSGDWSNAAWSKVGTAGTSGHADPAGGALAFEKILSTLNTQELFQTISGYTASATLATSFWCRVVSAGTGAGLTCENPSNGVGTRKFSFLPTGSWQRFTGTYPADTSGVGGLDFSSVDGSNWTVQFWGAQQEQLPFATSYIPTTAASVTRSAEIETVPWVNAPCDMWVYLKYIDAGAALNSGFLLSFGDDGASGANLNRFSVQAQSGAGPKVAFVNGTNSTAQPTGAVNVGDSVEILASLSAAGVASGTQAINGGAETTASGSAAGAPGTAWNNANLFLGALNNLGVTAFADYRALKVGFGPVPTMTQVRVLG